MEYTPIRVQDLPQKTTNEIDVDNTALLLTEFKLDNTSESYTVNYLDFITTVLPTDINKDNRYALTYFPSQFVLDGINNILTFLDENGEITNTDLFLNTRPEEVNIQLTDVTNYNLFLCNVLPEDDSFTTTRINLIPPILDLTNAINLRRAIKLNITFIQSNLTTIPLHEAFEIYIGNQRIDLINDNYSIYEKYFTLEIIINGASGASNISFQYINNTPQLLANIAADLQEQINELQPTPIENKNYFTSNTIIVPSPLNSDEDLWNTANYGLRPTQVIIDYSQDPKNTYNIFYVNSGNGTTTFKIYGLQDVPQNENFYVDVQLLQQENNNQTIAESVFFIFYFEPSNAPIQTIAYTYVLDVATGYRDQISLKFNCDNNSVVYVDSPNAPDIQTAELVDLVNQLINQGTGGNPVITQDITIANSGTSAVFTPNLDTDYVLNLNIQPITNNPNTIEQFSSFLGNLNINKANLQSGKFINILMVVDYSGLPLGKGSKGTGLTIDNYHDIDINFSSKVYTLFRCDANVLLKTASDILVRPTYDNYMNYMMAFAKLANRSANTSSLKMGFYRPYYDRSINNTIGGRGACFQVPHPDIYISNYKSTNNTAESPMQFYGKPFFEKNWFVYQILNPVVNSPNTNATAYTAGIANYFDNLLNPNQTGNFIATWVVPYYVPFKDNHGIQTDTINDYFYQTQPQAFQYKSFPIGTGALGGGNKTGVLVEAFILGYHKTLGEMMFYIKEDVVTNVFIARNFNVSFPVYLGFLGVQTELANNTQGPNYTRYFSLNTNLDSTPDPVESRFWLDVPNGKIAPPVNYSNYVFTLPDTIAVGTDMTNFMNALYITTPRLPAGKTRSLNYTSVLLGTFDGLLIPVAGAISGIETSLTIQGLSQCVLSPYNAVLNTQTFVPPFIRTNQSNTSANNNRGAMQSYGNTPY